MTIIIMIIIIKGEKEGKSAKIQSELEYRPKDKNTNNSTIIPNMCPIPIMLQPDPPNPKYIIMLLLGHYCFLTTFFASKVAV